MAQPIADEDAAVDARLRRIEEALRALDERIAALEGRAVGEPGARVAAVEAPAAAASLPGPPRTTERPDVASLLPLCGRSFMVLGGAFLLRALTESGLLPGAAGIALGALYALVWLVVADRAAGSGRRVSATFHGVTALLVAFPLAWEAATRFGLLPGGTSAAALGAVTGPALVVAWRRRVHGLAAAAVVGGLATALVLMAVTGQVAAFALLFVALGVAALWLGYSCDWFWWRWPAALVADVVVVGLITRALSPERLERPAVAIAVALGLLAAYLGSFAARTLVRGRLVIPFEVVQTVAALAIGLGGSVMVAHRSGVGEVLLGVASAALGLGTYAVAFAFVERRQGLGANFHFYATLALVLTLVGAATVLSGPVFAGLCAAAAVAATWLAHEYGRVALAMHGAIYALVGAAVSGLASLGMEALLGTPTSTGLALPAWTVLLAAVCCLALPRSVPGSAPSPADSVPRVVLAVVALVGGGAAAVLAVSSSIAGTPPDAGALATLRTAVVAVAALGLAAATRHPRTTEIGWLLYPVLGAGALKLLVEDFRHSRPATLFAALALFGAALVLAPRLARRAGSSPESA